MRIKERAYAKLNIYLKIGEIQKDGLHLVDTVMQTIGLADDLEIEEYPELVPTKRWQSVDRAAVALKEYGGYDGGARFKLNKRIPIAAGLGGGSADAAAALRGLNKLWKLGLGAERLREVALTVGSDVPFMVGGGRARVSATGGTVERLADQRRTFVVVVPGCVVPADKTARMFKEWEKSRPKSDHDNDFEPIASRVYDGHDELVSELTKLSGLNWKLSGAGPALFCEPDNRERARRIYDRVVGLEGNKTFVVDAQDGLNEDEFGGLS